MTHMSNATILTTPSGPSSASAAPNVDLDAIASGYRRSRVLFAAIELGVFEFTCERRTVAEIERRMGLHPRASHEFLDALVGLELLVRTPGPGGDVYENSPSTNRHLVSSSPQFFGVDLLERGRRSYCHWHWLTDALRTGEPQNEVADGLDGAPGPDPEYCRRGVTFEQFAASISLAESSWWSVVAVDASLAVPLAIAHPSTMGTVVTTSSAAPGVRAQLVLAGLDDRVSVAECDLFADVLPPTDICVVDGLRDYTTTEREMLLTRVRSALAPDGALVVVDDVIDDERRLNAPALLSALDAVVEGSACLGYTASDFDAWCRDAGFVGTEIAPIAGAASAAIAYTTITDTEDPS